MGWNPSAYRYSPVGSRANEFLVPASCAEAITDIVPSSATCTVLKDPGQVKYAVCPCALKVRAEGFVHVEIEFELSAVRAPVLLSIE